MPKWWQDGTIHSLSVAAVVTLTRLFYDQSGDQEHFFYRCPKQIAFFLLWCKILNSQLSGHTGNDKGIDELIIHHVCAQQMFPVSLLHVRYWSRVGEQNNEEETQCLPCRAYSEVSEKQTSQSHSETLNGKEEGGRCWRACKRRDKEKGRLCWGNGAEAEI